MNIGILGAGTWGMSLARMLFNMGHVVTVWSVSENEIKTYSASRRHPNLPMMVIPDGVRLTTSIAEACEGCEMLVVAVPSLYIRETARKMRPYIDNGKIIVNVAKGIEADTLHTMTEVIDDVLKDRDLDIKIVALSGPTHAEEVAQDMPTTIVAACDNLKAAKTVQSAFMNDNMRVYTNPDVLGVELCGAMKNIIALAAGISRGIGYGDNARAALITRGIAEMTRLGVAMGCNEQTFAGLAGIGDLIVTATSEHSRNNRAGQLIGAGVPPHEAIRSIGMVVEGVNALPAAKRLSEIYNVDMPIIDAVDKIINQGISPLEIVGELMRRPKTTELVRRS